MHSFCNIVRETVRVWRADVAHEEQVAMIVNSAATLTPVSVPCNSSASASLRTGRYTSEKFIVI